MPRNYLWIEFIYQRLHQDVLAHFEKEVYLMNQEGDKNQWNTHQKRGWKHFLDGGMVKKVTARYEGNYTFDFLDKSNSEKHRLVFSSTRKKSGCDFLDYIQSVLKADPKIFVKIENLEVHDARKYLLSIPRIIITHTYIDSYLLEVITKYFPKLIMLSFEQCMISKECDFSKFTIPISFLECQIENIRSFHHSRSPLKFDRTEIQKISPATILSPKINISCFSKEHFIPLKELFFMCNFPNLLTFSIIPDSQYESYSFQDAFTYLPDSAPLLENIKIQGKVKSLSFLTKFSHLINCDIQSIFDDYDLGYASITDGKEKTQILKRNDISYQIEKELHPNQPDCFIISELETKRILKLSHFLSRLQYSKQEKERLENLFTHSEKNMVLSKIDKEIPYYYECYYDILSFKKQLTDMEAILERKEKYHFFFGSLCSYPVKHFVFQKQNNVDSKDIVKAKNFLFYLNSIPILFQKSPKIIHTLEEAKQRKLESEKKISVSMPKRVDIWKDIFENLELEEPIRPSDLKLLIEEQFGISLSKKDFVINEHNSKIYHLFEQEERYQQRDYLIKAKIQKCKEDLATLILEHYSEWTLAEKAFLYSDRFEMNIAESIDDQEKFRLFFKQNFGFAEEEIIQSIQQKTNGLYQKYRNKIRGFEKMLSLDIYPNQLSIGKEDIKQFIFQKKEKS